MESHDSQLRWADLVSTLALETSKTQLGKRLGVTYKEIARWVKGEAIPQARYRDALISECERNSINWRKFKGVTPVYDAAASYERNVADGPKGLPAHFDRFIPLVPTRILDFELNSPIGLSASMLTINSHWIGPFANLGFDIITAKTVRTREYYPHPMPNIVYLPEISDPLPAGSTLEQVRATTDLPYQPSGGVSFANSFGMPSTDPRLWQEDLRRSLSLLHKKQILIASIVGTPPPSKTSEVSSELVNDFVTCAHLAYEVEPHFIELNFSCPNVYGKEGSIFHDAELAGRICRKIAKELPEARILLKLAYLPPDELEKFLIATHKYVVGYTAINTLAARVVSMGQREEPAFTGENRLTAGVSGTAIRNHGLEVTQNIRAFAEKNHPELIIFGVGGISSAQHVKQYMNNGANAVQICSAAISNPFIAIEIRKAISRDLNPTSKSLLLENAGIAVPFRDSVSAKAFETTLTVSARTGIPFEIAYRALQKNWLNSYLGELSAIQTSDSTIKTRRHAPTESQIEAWIREEHTKQ